VVEETLAFEERKGADGGHDLRSVDEREPFLRLQDEGLDPGGLQNARRRNEPTPARDLSLADEDERQVASGARSPEAPTLPWEGMRGTIPA